MGFELVETLPEAVVSGEGFAMDEASNSAPRCLRGDMSALFAELNQLWPGRWLQLPVRTRQRIVVRAGLELPR